MPQSNERPGKAGQYPAIKQATYSVNSSIGIDWQLARLPALQPLTLHRILQARQQVFVVEQHCVFLDADATDESAWHLAGWLPRQQLAAYARIVDPGVKYAEASIGRVLTSQGVRGSGLGRELVRRAIGHAAKLWPGVGLRISAQSHLRAFYADQGFAAVGNEYLEDDIPHIEMLRVFSLAGQQAGFQCSD